MELIVNGNPVQVEPQPGEMLAHVLRERLGLTGTKIGCEEAECGACTVLVDGVPVLSCTYPAARAAGKSVLTIEGLGFFPHSQPVLQSEKGEQPSTPASLSQGGGRIPASPAHLSTEEGRLPPLALHPLQEEFIRHGAVQCGFCIPGQIMTAYALLQNNPNPSEEEIRHALKDTLCRCAGYPSIIRAVLSAARRLRGEEPLPPVVAPVVSEEGKPKPTLQIIGTLQP
ncbi:MAG: (2Fe-2S)-binding protein, partial [Anaerolineales bacterium]|nr:(2Fe-2S)-binding protein [Anaerolineales bacterium]